jgi:hypothetical protein
MDVPNPIVPLLLLKTFSILEHALPEIVSWSEAGDSFIVQDPARFGSDVVSSYFNHSKFSSFVRQLNFYGFRKVKGKLNFIGMSEQHSLEFKHPFFLRGRPDLMTEIKRHSSTHGSSNISGGSSISPIDTHTQHKQEHLGVSSEADGETIEELRSHVRRLDSKLQHLTKIVDTMQETFSQYQEGNYSLNDDASVVSSATDIQNDDIASDTNTIDWDIGDDEILLTFLNNLNEGLSLPELDKGGKGNRPSLKRSRSGEDAGEQATSEPDRQTDWSNNWSNTASTAVSAAAAITAAITAAEGKNKLRTIEKIVQVVANAAMFNKQSGDTREVAAVAYDQYVAAVAAILSCAGMPRTRALTTSAAVLSQTQKQVQAVAEVQVQQVQVHGHDRSLAACGRGQSL